MRADGGGLVTTALSTSLLACAICFDTFPAGRTRSAACSAHFYCDECWRGYIRAAVEDGPRCLSLRCPDPACSAAVVRELVDAVAGGGDDGERYARFALRSYVEESGGRIKWCPGPGCAHAVEFVGCAGADVLCRALPIRRSRAAPISLLEGAEPSGRPARKASRAGAGGDDRAQGASVRPGSI